MEERNNDSREDRGGRRGDSQPMFARRRRPRPSSDLVLTTKTLNF